MSFFYSFIIIFLIFEVILILKPMTIINTIEELETDGFWNSEIKYKDTFPMFFILFQIIYIVWIIMGMLFTKDVGIFIFLSFFGFFTSYVLGKKKKYSQKINIIIFSRLIFSCTLVWLFIKYFML